MKIKNIEFEKCDNCPLIDYCGNPYSEVKLCSDERIKDLDVATYKTMAENVSYVDVKKKAAELELIINSDDELDEEAQELFDDENDCGDNYKQAVLELIVDSFNLSQIKEDNKQCSSCCYMGQKWDPESPCFTCRDKKHFQQK